MDPQLFIKHLKSLLGIGIFYKHFKQYPCMQDGLK